MRIKRPYQTLVLLPDSVVSVLPPVTGSSVGSGTTGGVTSAVLAFTGSLALSEGVSGVLAVSGAGGAESVAGADTTATWAQTGISGDGNFAIWTATFADATTVILKVENEVTVNI